MIRAPPPRPRRANSSTRARAARTVPSSSRVRPPAPAVGRAGLESAVGATWTRSRGRSQLRAVPRSASERCGGAAGRASVTGSASVLWAGRVRNDCRCSQLPRRGGRRGEIPGRGWNRRPHLRAVPGVDQPGPRRLHRRRLGRRRDCHRRRSHRSGRRRRSDGRRRFHRGRRQEQQRIEVSLRILDSTDAEVDERLSELGAGARPNGADDLTVLDRHPTRDHERPEVQQGHRKSLGRQKRQRLASVGDGPREGDRRVDRRAHRRPDGGANRDAAVLARRLGSQLVEEERLENRALHRPRPGSRDSGDEE
jgi:hypothetical protein